MKEDSSEIFDIASVARILASLESQYIDRQTLFIVCRHSTGEHDRLSSNITLIYCFLKFDLVGDADWFQGGIIAR